MFKTFFFFFFKIYLACAVSKQFCLPSFLQLSLLEMRHRTDVFLTLVKGAASNVPKCF